MKFDIVTIFPKIFDSYFNESIIKRAREKKLIDINVVNLRDFTNDKHKTVDDSPFGGGAGMVLKIQPIFDCVESLKFQPKAGPPLAEKAHIILFSAKGKKYTQQDAKRLSKYDNLILICGRYEGVDERVAKYVADEEISIGDYVLTGGEVPAMAVIDSITRLIPGALGNEESPKNESHNKKGYLEHPQYTRPEKFNNWKVPEVLLSGNHKEIEKWREKNSKS
jgi:tRNA (guanine37-N1)-methyltransferase